MIPSFRDELQILINKHGIENRSNTPDYILADFLIKCLHNYEETFAGRARF